ncbi:GNAT family N-acetyltransferase [Enterovirga sp.]|jgi:GNAT superfamily N-acetyltransferase|uniref:GNAT family N-acetyltransferase n=1 Tax=Enterovirga sp. TaxID=2026350 RepID=UPI00262525A9|nr:GNAT family N-acetyltransferase [Enterovirga sp.]MDB5590665.1 acetyltransferase, family [Enterovirga sp.]
MSAASAVAIRPARPGDAPVILGLIRELAAYERLLHEVDATESLLDAALFGPEPRAHCDLAEVGGVAAGFALWFRSFSTFRGRAGIYLEDLYVPPEFRGRGIGRALLAGLARRCREEDLPRLEWSVLDWNAPALGFYASLGAEPMSGWTRLRLGGAELARLGEEPS